jgi:hypothetical protein
LSFDPQALGAERFIHLQLYAHFEAAQFSGSLRAGFEDGSSAHIVGFRAPELARWGATSSAPPCGL